VGINAAENTRKQKLERNLSLLEEKFLILSMPLTCLFIYLGGV